MKKKIFALALAAVMLVSGAMTAMAADSLSGGWWAAGSWSNSYKVEGTVEFDIDVKGGDANYNNFSAVFVNVDVKAADPRTANPATPEGYKEYAVIRTDSWGWGGGDNKSVDGKDITYKSTLTDLDGDGDVWTDFRAIMKDAHVDAKITKTSTGVSLEYKVTGKNGNSFTYTASTEFDASEGLYVFFACDNSTVSVAKVEAAPANPNVPAKGDMSSVMTYVVLFVGAALVVVAARKRFA